MAKVSVIIPVYNAAPYLDRCISGLLSQTESDCEFIFVNDGSTDESLKILSAAADSDPRVVLIDQPNGGVSAARNAGLDAATSDYIAFADADDRTESRYIEALYGRLIESGAGLSVCGLRNPQERALRLGITKLGAEDQAKVLELFESYLIHNVYCKLYRREVIENNRIRFDPAHDYGEDFLFNLDYVRHIGTVATTPEILYFYDFSVEGSLSTKFNMKRFLSVELQNRATEDYFAALGIASAESKAYLDRLFYWNAYDAVHDFLPKLGVLPKFEAIAGIGKIRSFGYFAKAVKPAARPTLPIMIFSLRNPALIRLVLLIYRKLRRTPD
jgi:glycosyltransferase EpsJ